MRAMHIHVIQLSNSNVATRFKEGRTCASLVEFGKVDIPLVVMMTSKPNLG